ncbi:hypothetical protein HD806DRAFT_534422 [Xylariaceae sp. AK1471]|nr:hypothetical protein HD806DRAFT_534422 [Xylariaceae sp. AK1471]
MSLVTLESRSQHLSLDLIDGPYSRAISLSLLCSLPEAQIISWWMEELSIRASLATQHRFPIESRRSSYNALEGLAIREPVARSKDCFIVCLAQSTSARSTLREIGLLAIFTSVVATRRSYYPSQECDQYRGRCGYCENQTVETEEHLDYHDIYQTITTTNIINQAAATGFSPASRRVVGLEIDRRWNGLFGHRSGRPGLSPSLVDLVRYVVDSKDQLMGVA